jgi:hypothetical protein
MLPVAASAGDAPLAANPAGASAIEMIAVSTFRRVGCGLRTRPALTDGVLAFMIFSRFMSNEMLNGCPLSCVSA